MKKKFGHTIDRTAPGEFKITLDRRAGSLLPGSANDPYMLATLMTLNDLHADLNREREVEEMIADEPEPVTVPPDASHSERRIAALQNQAVDQKSLDAALLNEGLPPATFIGNPERAQARKRIRERGAAFVSSDAFDRVTSRIKSFAQTIGLIERNELSEE